MWVYGHYRALTTLYRTDVEWFSTRYRLGPPPLGADHVSLRCLLLSAEYPQLARAVLSGCVPQTSAIFLLTMLQTFGDEMRCIHYSGSADQLNGHRFESFLASFGDWNVPDNPWRFLFKDGTSFELSVAVRKARETTNGDTMLKALFHGGLCAVARQFYKPDVDAPTITYV